MPEIGQELVQWKFQSCCDGSLGVVVNDAMAMSLDCCADGVVDPRCCSGTTVMQWWCLGRSVAVVQVLLWEKGRVSLGESSLWKEQLLLGRAIGPRQAQINSEGH